MVPKDHDRIGSHWRSDSRDGQVGERGSHTLLQKKNSTCTVAIGGYVRIFVGSHTMPWRHRPDFKEALSTLRRLKNEEDQAYYQNWWQSSSSSWWQWQDSWWHPSSETSPRRWTWHWWSGWTCENSELYIYLLNESQNEFGAKVTVINSVTANAVYCHRRVCKEYTSYYTKLATETL